MNQGAKLFWLVASLLGGALAIGLQSGCQTTPPPPWESVTPSSNNIPRLSLVEPSVWRGGQPDRAGFAWLKSIGVSNVIKLNADSEGSDLPGSDLGLNVKHLPISTIEQLVEGPDPRQISKAVGDITPGTFVHCTHGEDRTGLVIGLYRLTEGTNKATAWQEMLNHGFHPALHGLHEYWENQPDTTR